MQFRLAEVSDADSIVAYVQACHQAQEDDCIPFYDTFPDAQSFLLAQENWRREEAVPEGIVPSSLYVLVEEDTILGTLVLRHELNAFLKTYIGHIGYRIHPQYRGHGYAYKMLKEAIQEAETKHGITALMISCAHDNIASRKTIEKAKGRWVRRYEVPETKECYDIFTIGGKKHD